MFHGTTKAWGHMAVCLLLFPTVARASPIHRECSNDEHWILPGTERAGKRNCRWVGRDPHTRCDRETAADQCPASCHPSCCRDEPSFRFLSSGQERDCRWLETLSKDNPKKQSRKCRKKASDDGRRVGDFCRRTCGTCRHDEQAPKQDEEPPSFQRRKNIIFFMTDDQDVTGNGTDPWVMPNLNRLFREEGMEFDNYYVTTALCCPSRAIILRGQYCHNTEIYDNGENHDSSTGHSTGGYNKFKDLLGDETFATLLKDAGYETAYIGKIMNKYFPKSPALPGWDHWMANGGGKFHGANFGGVRTDQTVYATDYIRDWVNDFLTHRRYPNKPFFLFVAPYAPHSPATPARRHEDLFPGVTAPRLPSFNPPNKYQKQKPSYLKHFPKMTKDQIEKDDKFYRKQLQCLVSVDEAVGSISETLDALGLTDDTFFIYTSDNGMHYGDHRQPAGKRMAYETDIRVPFLVRGPGVPKGTKSSQMVQSVDLAATFSDIAQAADPTTYRMDGKSFLPLLRSDDRPESSSSTHNDFRWAGLFELYSGSSNYQRKVYEGMPGYHSEQRSFYPNTYQAVRILRGPYEWAREANLLYVEWCTGEQELYDMTEDPYQLNNLLYPATEENTAPFLPLVLKLSKLLWRFANCAGENCYEIEDDFFDSNGNDDYYSTTTLERLKNMIKFRNPCFNPPDDEFDPLARVTNTSLSVNHRRKLWAYDLYVPEPFEHGHFPFSDSEEVPEELLEVWEAYQHYFE